MKKILFALASLSLLMACTPEENNPSGTDEPEGGKDKTVHVTGISLDRNSAAIKEGEYITLVATVTPSNADNKSVSWSSSSDAVATVDASGKVTGVKAGSATITAITADGGMKASCALSVEANLAPSVTVEAKNISAISAVLAGKANLGSTVASDLKVGFQYSKSAGILPSNSTTVEAADSDADYNYTTGITGLEPSMTYYFRSFVRQNGQDTYGETKEFTTKDLETLIGTKDASDIKANKAFLNAKLDLTDVKHEGIEYGFYWGASEESMNSYIKGGDIVGNAYASSLTGLFHKTQYWFKAYVKLDSQTFYGEVKTFTTDVAPVESVSLDETEYTFYTIGNTINLNATVLPEDATDKSVEWSSDNEEVAQVDNNGKVRAIGNGKATITVTTNDQGKTAACVITVAQYVTGISLDKTSLSLVEGETYTLTATITPDNANDKTVTWTSSDESVAKVDENGIVTAASKGTATIKATANDGSGNYSSCFVTVLDAFRAVDLGLSVKWASCNIGSSKPEEYGDYYAWGETEPKQLSYKWFDGDQYHIIKYNYLSSFGPIDNKMVLEPEDDVATITLGEGWRIPTYEEGKELIENCTKEYYVMNGVKGYLFTSRVPGYTEQSIFLPYAGSFNGRDYELVGIGAFYWSSTLCTGPTSACWPNHAFTIFDTYLSGRQKDHLEYLRSLGHSIRPVFDK